MSWDRELAVYIAVNDSIDSAEVDPGAIEVTPEGESHWDRSLASR